MLFTSIKVENMKYEVLRQQEILYNQELLNKIK